MINLTMTNGDSIRTKSGDLNFWVQRMVTTDIQLTKDESTGDYVAINPKYIAYVSEEND